MVDARRLARVFCDLANRRALTYDPAVNLSRIRIGCLLLLALSVSVTSAGEALVAVAANFAEVMSELEQRFEAGGEHRLTVTVGSTGKLYAQIRYGAPFDILLAADQERPRLLAESGLAVAESQQTYALGRLVLWSADAQSMDDGEQRLRVGSFRSLAIANPDLAPYGAAAVESLQAIGAYDGVRPRIVMGENIGQAHTMVATGNAELGLVALSYVISQRNGKPGGIWVVPGDLHAPIRQDAVLLTRAAGNQTAREFMQFLKSAAARQVIEQYGYAVE